MRLFLSESPWKHRKATTNRVLVNRLRALPGIEMLSVGTAAPSSGSTNTTLATYKDGKKDVNTEVEVRYADENYIKLYKIKILAGRNIQAGDSTTALVINEKYARVLGFTNPQKIVGKQLEKFNGLKNVRMYWRYQRFLFAFAAIANKSHWQFWQAALTIFMKQAPSILL